LRHTFASHFIEQTRDLPALQQILGHHSLKMTQRYAHLAKGYLNRTMESFSSGMPDIDTSKLDGHQYGHQPVEGITGDSDFFGKTL